jgi:hypothetical protein
MQFFFEKEHGIDWAFSRHKEWPKILKCFIFGRDDVLFHERLLSEKAVFYSYQQEWETEYSKKTR